MLPIIPLDISSLKSAASALAKSSVRVIGRVRYSNGLASQCWALVSALYSWGEMVRFE